MHKEPNEKLIGLFMICGLLVFATVFGIFLKQKVFTDDDQVVVMYFEESIKGLSVGSSVVFKGVEIGKVAKIDLIADARTLDFSIPVFVKMNDSQGLNYKGSESSKQEILDELIAKGLRARLTTQSYLTGQLMIELEMLPDTPVVLKNKHSINGIFEIPTVLSPIGELSKGIQDLPVKQSVEKFNLFFDQLNEQLPVILPQVKDIVNNLNTVVVENKDVSADTLDNLNKTIITVGEAAKSFRNLTDYLERHPEALLKGKKGY